MVAAVKAMSDAAAAAAANDDNSNQSQLPDLTNASINELGLTLLATGGPRPKLDVVLVHGLQGHPEKTWTFNAKAKTEHPKRDGKPHKWKIWKNEGKQASYNDDDGMSTSASDHKIFGPTQLLAFDLAEARIFTYGYDSRVSHFFNGPANQSTISDNGRGLLSSIAS